MRRFFLTASSAILAASAMPACRKQERATTPERAGVVHADKPIEPVVPGQVGTIGEITKGIRRGLSGIRTRCDEGLPSAESRAEWRRLSEPRALQSMPLNILVKKPDHDLLGEVDSRLLDQSYTVGFKGMTRAEQNLYFVMQFEAEVVNGGFQQFFANSSGNCAMRTEAALEETPGLAAWAAIYHRALQKFPAGRPSEDRATRGDQMEAMEDEYGAWSDGRP